MLSLAKKLLYCSVLLVVVAVVWRWANYVDVKGNVATVLLQMFDVCVGACPEFYAGKRVLLTGASRGIGKGLAIRLAQLGAK
jgi:NADPH:quinone reductase-like Zn-dependent oxidoreductase